MRPEDEDPVEAARVITAATEVLRMLRDLRLVLEPTREIWSGGSAELDPADEWTIAVNGLFGPGGVVGQIGGETMAQWAASHDAGWAGPASDRD